jgi:hypothetical protein
MHNRLYFAFIAIPGMLLAPALAMAYVGPGAGLTMLGSLWGLILAVVFIVFGLLILPIKIMRNRMKKKKETEEEGSDNSEGSGKGQTQD